MQVRVAGEGRTRLSESCGLALHPHPGQPASEPGAPLLDNRAAPPVLPWQTGGQLSPFQARRRPPFTPTSCTSDPAPNTALASPPAVLFSPSLEPQGLCTSCLLPGLSRHVPSSQRPALATLPEGSCTASCTLRPSLVDPCFLRALTSPSSVSPSSGKPRRLHSQPRCRPGAKRVDEQKAQREIRRQQGGHRP